MTSLIFIKITHWNQSISLFLRLNKFTIIDGCKLFTFLSKIKKKSITGMQLFRVIVKREPYSYQEIFISWLESNIKRLKDTFYSLFSVSFFFFFLSRGACICSHQNSTWWVWEDWLLINSSLRNNVFSFNHLQTSPQLTCSDSRPQFISQQLIICPLGVLGQAILVEEINFLKSVWLRYSGVIAPYRPTIVRVLLKCISWLLIYCRWERI